MSAPLSLTRDLADEAATIRLAEDIAMVLAPGDVIALEGDLGAGKTTFSRALLRALADDAFLEVPSPTFTIAQSYEALRVPVVHFDLYRLGSAEELDEIGFDDALEIGAALIEWPDRADGLLPADRLILSLEIVGAGDARRATLTSVGEGWAERLSRSFALRAFLDEAGWTGAERRHLQGDASTRSYERIRRDGEHAVLMNAPRRPDGPPVADGKPYSQIARLAEDVRPFVAIGETLRANGFSAPELFAHDLDAGLLLLEDLGGEGVVEEGAPIAERYGVATDVLADIHGLDWPDSVPLPDGSIHHVPPYDEAALTIEVRLLADWYVPHMTGGELDGAALDEFLALWRERFDALDQAEKSWVLRDCHSPNLIWLPEREGPARIGLIDYQDAVIGPAAYDLASLLQDARVTVPPELEQVLFARYLERRRAADTDFDRDTFAAAYATMAAQRATKVLGIFARLNHRDGKPVYLAHIPRVRDYLYRSLTHPVLSGLKLWYESHLPTGS
ncbi:MAG: tRNA (adenosine(37)-N6)-threonylcarbamoyltransferase complex ATPase subunit type 1 TsaE [Hyphomicrobiales bacterium]|nr:MAG: tRNA (adenosine(37)-N6)-threonylcarbamoyltransferase complex ATPase subunit type 1 TsaE [Hyphomicrobiales bacterium]